MEPIVLMLALCMPSGELPQAILPCAVQCDGNQCMVLEVSVVAEVAAPVPKAVAAVARRSVGCVGKAVRVAVKPIKAIAKVKPARSVAKGVVKIRPARAVAKGVRLICPRRRCCRE